MQVEYFKGKKVVIKKPGHFNGMIGTIKSIKLEIDFGFSIGTWSFSEGELELVEAGMLPEMADPLTKKEKEAFKKAFEDSKTDDKFVVEAKSNIPTMSEIPKKRVYKKRASKPKEVTQKRKYTRRAKS